MTDTDIKIDEKELREAVLASLDRKKKLRRAGLTVGTLIVLFVWFMFQPLRAGPVYGLCRTFLELHVRYPTSLKLTQYDVFGPSIRLFYTFRDAFGVQRSEMIECIARPDDVNGFIMETIKVNREQLDPEIVKSFNFAIPGILASEPSLVIPSPPKSGDLIDLKRD